MKKIPISFKSFEKSMFNFVEKRVTGLKKTDIKNENELPLIYKKVKSGNDFVHLTLLLDCDEIYKTAKELVKKYKSQPYSRKSAYRIIPKKNFNIIPTRSGGGKMVETDEMNPVRNFVLSWNVDKEYVYFKFFIRFKHGKKNIRVKQMKIKYV